MIVKKCLLRKVGGSRASYGFGIPIALINSELLKPGQRYDLVISTTQDFVPADKLKESS